MYRALEEKKNNPICISLHSPHLWGKIQRFLSPEDTALCNQAFAFAVKHGALWELDFVRPDKESLNPRPARVSLILINEANKQDPIVIAGAMLASIWTEDLNKEILDLFPLRVSKLGKDAAQILFLKDWREKDHDALLIASALHLDRARHFHRVKTYQEQQVMDFLSETDCAILAIAHCCPHIATLLTSWKERFVNQLNARKNKDKILK